jgi:PKD repeat protein
MKWIFIVLILNLLNLSAQVEPIDTDGNGFRNVSTLEHLRWISEKSDSITEWYFELDNDINAAETRNWNIGDHDNNPETPDSAMGWRPIGYQKRGYTQWNKNISGTINGNGFVIDSLYCNMPYDANVAFIAFAKEYSLSIHDLGITNCSIRGSNTAALVAWNGGHLIENCFSTGKIVSHGNSAGGLVAHHFRGEIKNCYSHCDVRSKRIHAVTNSGGLVGSVDIADIENSYSTGRVIGDYEQGGFICSKYSGDITSCFWDTETSGLSNSAAGTGRTTAAMKTRATFTDAGWDFENVWNIADTINNGYPYLNGFDYPITINENKIALDWIQKPRYRYVELEKGISRIEVNNSQDSVILKYYDDLQILDIGMDTILADADNPDNLELFLSPDLKTYVLIAKNVSSHVNQYKFFTTYNQEKFYETYFQYEWVQHGDGCRGYSCIYPYYSYDAPGLAFLHGDYQCYLTGTYSWHQYSCNGYDISRDNRYRMIYHSSSNSEDNDELYKSEDTENQRYYIKDVNEDRIQDFYSSSYYYLYQSSPKRRIETFDESGIYYNKTYFDNNGTAYLRNDNKFYKFDLENWKLTDTIVFDYNVRGFSYHGDNLIFTSGNTIYYYDYDKERITKEMNFDFDFYSAAIASTDSTIILGATGSVMFDHKPKYSYYLAHFKIEDMEEYFNSDFYAVRDTVTIGDTVEFKSLAADPLWNFRWEFGDGNTSDEQNPKHFYEKTGYYSVRQIVNDNSRYDTTYKHEYIFVRPKIKSLFYAEQEYIHKNEYIQFRDTSIGENLKYIWDFGDGHMSFDREPLHMYKDTGRYDVSLIVWNNELKDTLIQNKLINVMPDLIPQFEYTISDFGDRISVTAQDNSEGWIENWKWLTFKGDTLYGQDINVMYDEPGVYHLKLIVNDGYFSDSTTSYFVAYIPENNLGIKYNTFDIYKNKSSFDSLNLDNIKNGNNFIAFDKKSAIIFDRYNMLLNDEYAKDDSSYYVIANNRLYNVFKQDTSIVIKSGVNSEIINIGNNDFSIYKVIYFKYFNKLCIFTHNNYATMTLFDLYSKSTDINVIDEKGIIDDLQIYDDKIYMNILEWERSYSDYTYEHSNRIRIFDYEGKQIEYKGFWFGTYWEKSEFLHFKPFVVLDTSIVFFKGRKNKPTAFYWDIETETSRDWERIESDSSFQVSNIEKFIKYDEKRALVLGSNDGMASLEIFDIDSLTSKLITLNIEGKILDGESDGNLITFYGLYKQNSEQYTFFELTTTPEMLSIEKDTNVEDSEEPHIYIKRNIAFYPNPASEMLSIEYSAAYNEIIEISVLDVSGRKLFTKNVYVTSGKNYYDISVADLVRGVYLLNIKTVAGVISKKFVKM